MSQGRTYSEETLAKIDAEVRRLVEDAHQKAVNLLKSNSDKLEVLAQELLQNESVDRQRVLEIAGVPSKPVLQDDTLTDVEPTTEAEQEQQGA
jgi:cell division protease FtsH